MKKSISLFLIVAMLFSMSSVAFAADNVQMEPELFEEYAVDTGIFYRYTLDYVGDEWDAIILCLTMEVQYRFLLQRLHLWWKESWMKQMMEYIA